MASQINTLRRHVMRSLLPATLGGTFGLLLARWSLAPEQFSGSSVPAIYGAGGAATAILLVRLAAILRLVLRDYRQQ